MTNTASDTRNAPITLARATLLTRGPFGYSVMLVRDLTVTIRPYAQYSHAVEIRFTEKGKRKASGFMETYKPGLVVLEGHVEVKLESAMEHCAGSPGVTCSRTRYESYDSRYDSDFARWLDASKLTVARDFRGHNPHTGEISAEQGE